MVKLNKSDPSGKLWGSAAGKKKKAAVVVTNAAGQPSTPTRSRSFVRDLSCLGLGALIVLCIGYYDEMVSWRSDVAGSDNDDNIGDVVMKKKNFGKSIFSVPSPAPEESVQAPPPTSPSSSSSLRSPNDPRPSSTSDADANSSPTTINSRDDPKQTTKGKDEETSTSTGAVVDNPASTTSKNDHEDDNNNNNKSQVKASSSGSASSCVPAATPADCRKSKFHHGYDLLDRNQLLDLAQDEKQRLLNKLYVDYGRENFENIFVDPTSKNLTSSRHKYHGIIEQVQNGRSVEALKRKFLIKVLQVQIQLQEQSSNADASDGGDEDCHCSTNPKKIKHNPNNNNEEVDITNTFQQYVWATGGHSASAGHGNMYNESYTAYLDRDMSPWLAAFGIEFIGRNYAMGGTSCGLEISSCYEQIFGTDVDICSWDYGMTTGKAAAKSLHFAYRCGLSAGRPILVTLRNNYNFNDRITTLPQFVDDKNVAKLMKDALPDSGISSGLTDEELLKMPEYVRNFKCSGAEKEQLERGDPYCSDERYTNYYCPDRKKKAWWHPGL